MLFEFVILDWAAHADGLTSHQDWLTWAAGDAVLPAPHLTQVPALTEMPAMMRRRVDRLGRLACQVAYWCEQTDRALPIVFASRYGDAHRSLALLGDLVQQQPLSPTGFALSVHNAIAALYSIARGRTENAVVVSAGRATATAALVEAAGLIADGAPEVLVVCYDAPLPPAYAHFQDEAGCEFAWAWRVGGVQRAAEGIRVALSLSASVSAGEAAHLPSGVSSSDAWPEGLAVLRQCLRHLASATAHVPLVRSMDRPGVTARWSVVHA